MADSRVAKIGWYTGLLFLLTVPFWVWPLDLKLQGLLYDAASGRWTWEANPVFTVLYRYGTIPALLLAAWALAALTAGYFSGKFIKYRRTAAIVLIAMALGPGLLVNVILKNYTGRPRPRETAQFGGRMDFKYPLQPGLPGRGHSFPCGHCTMGFAFYALFVALRRQNRAAAFTWLGAGSALGVALGVARMAQGGHYASDVLWAAGITMLSAEAAAVITDSVKGWESLRKHRATVVASGVALFVAAVFFFLLATPFHTYKHYGLPPDSGRFSLETSGADVTLRAAPPGGGAYVQMEASGFGLPWSDFTDNGGPGGRYGYSAFKKGFFMELNASISADLPDSQGAVINAGTGSIDYSACTKGGELVLFSSSGDIIFAPAKGSSIKEVYLKAKKGRVTVILPEGITLRKGASLNISAGKEIEFKNSSAYYKEITEGAAKINGAKELYVKSRVPGGPELTATGAGIVIGTGK